MTHNTSDEPVQMLKAILLMSLFGWGLLLVAITDHTPSTTPALAGRLSH